MYETHTVEGCLPHVVTQIAGLTLHCPVRLAKHGTRIAIRRTNDRENLPIPQRDAHGRLVYVLPGGVDYVPEATA